jgi:RES domain-containing protein
VTSSPQGPRGETAALLPCPFCGTAVHVADGDDKHGWVSSYIVECRDDRECFATPRIEMTNRDDAIAAWNRRPAAPEAQPPRDYTLEVALIRRAATHEAMKAVGGSYAESQIMNALADELASRPAAVEVVDAPRPRYAVCQDYAIALQRCIEHHVRGVVIPPEIAAVAPFHAQKLNNALNSRPAPAPQRATSDEEPTIENLQQFADANSPAEDVATFAAMRVEDKRREGHRLLSCIGTEPDQDTRRALRAKLHGIIDALASPPITQPPTQDALQDTARLDWLEAHGWPGNLIKPSRELIDDEMRTDSEKAP